MSESVNVQLVKGFKELKLGAVLALLSDILVIASLFPLLLAMPRMMWWMSREEAPRSLREALAPLMPGMISAAALSVAALVVGIMALYLWYRASSTFRRYEEAMFGLGRIGAALALLGSLILVISLALIFLWIFNLSQMPWRSSDRVAVVLATPLLGAAGVLLGALTYVIGWILCGVMVMRLSEIPGMSPDFKYAGIMMIAGSVLFFIPQLSIVGALVEIASMIMILVHSDTAIKRLRVQ